MTNLIWREAVLAITDKKQLRLPDLVLGAGEFWAFVGGNGSGKTALARALCGELPLLAGEVQQGTRGLHLSFEQQQQLAEAEWQSRNTDMVGEDEEPGYTVRSLLLGSGGDEAQGQALLAQFGIAHLMERPYRYLSSGEGRKLLLARALLQAPDLLVLDEPFDGLDQASRAELMALLAQLHAQGQPLVLIVNRFDEIPAAASHMGLLSDCSLTVQGLREQVLASPEVAQLMVVEQQVVAGLPASLHPVRRVEQPLVIMRNIRVAYGEQTVIEGLDWTLSPGEHWQITGPNGAGKSTLLSLITGDHPQSYRNDLTLFGIRRGSGESIWDIKQHIGYVSPALHLDYRVATTPLQVILSGYYDSIGLYSRPGDRQLALAREWLALLGLVEHAQQPFHSLSFGQQRLVLIARALVKHPPLLILDEPLQGLDPLNRHLVKAVVSRLLAQGSSQLLFVSHHQDDAPAGLTHRLSFVPDGRGGYAYQQTRLAPDGRALSG